MRLISFLATAFVVTALAASTAFAGGRPIVNETVHSVDELFTDIGGNCATGNVSSRSVTFSGVLRTLVLADGSYRVRGSFRGDTVFDDLPADGTPDATAHFRFMLGDMVVSSGNVVYSEVWNGTTVALATGAELRFHITYKLVVDPAGTPKLEVFKFTCE